MILICGIELAEVSAPAPDSHDKLSVRFGMLLCVNELITVYRVELQLMSAEIYEGFNKFCDLLLPFLVSENAVVKLHCERSAVADLSKIIFCKALYYRERTAGLCCHRR